MDSSTLFPKITQHVAAVVKDLNGLDSGTNRQIGPIPIVGSVKLHGTHADILVYNDDRIVFQSKNVQNITLRNDNQGFATAMADKTNAIINIRDQYVTCWKKLNPTLPLVLRYPVLLAGEWIGTEIQKDVAVCLLPRRFVIVSVNVNNSWIPDTQYPCVECPSASIYNISRGPTFNGTLYVDDIPRTLSEVEPLAESVAASCPFAASFDTQGEGEGIVWKPAAPHLNSNPALWFKIKGGRFRPTFAPPPKALPEGEQEKRDAADAVAAIWCTKERLQQGLTFLDEIHVPRDMKALGRFLRWIQHDILTEEKGYLMENKVDEGILRISISKIAKVWYINRVAMGK